MSIDLANVRAVVMPGLGDIINPAHVASVVLTEEGMPVDGQRQYVVVVRMAFGRDYIIPIHLPYTKAFKLKNEIASAIFLDNVDRRLVDPTRRPDIPTDGSMNEKMLVACRNMAAILEDPQPGLSSWLEARERAAFTIRTLLYKVLTPDAD